MTVLSSGRELLFSPQDPVRSRLLQIIGDAKRTVDLSCYVFTLEALADVLVELRHAERRVRLIVSDDPDDRPGRRHSKTHLQRIQEVQVDRLRAVGVEYAHGLSSKRRIIHGKYGIVDDMVAWHGSYNWSADAEIQGNHICIEHEREPVLAFMNHFQEDWERLTNKTDTPLR